jgi:stage II sporulation protein D
MMRRRFTNRSRRLSRHFTRRRSSRRFFSFAFVVSVLSVSALFIGCRAIKKQPERIDTRPEAPPGPLVVDRLIRVRLVGSRPPDALTLQVASAYTVVDVETGRTLISAAEPLASSRVTPAAARPGMLIGNQYLDAAHVRFTPQRDAAIIVNGRTYRGALRVRREGGGLVPINELDIEEYLAGVLRGEMPRHFHPQAQRAQVVAARTYVLYQKVTAGTRRDYDVLADESSQVYLGVRGEDPAARAAVHDTYGEVCLLRRDGEERIFCTYYSSVCGGVTQSVTDFRPSDPAVPPLAGGVVCRHCSGAPRYKWGPVTLTKAEMTKRIFARYPRLTHLGQIMRIAATAESRDGRVTRMRLTGSGGATAELVGEDFRLCMGGHTLRSTNFRMNDTGEAVRFTDGRGFGHGVGICQYGADGRAKHGENYRAILLHYYPGASIEKIY